MMKKLLFSVLALGSLAFAVAQPAAKTIKDVAKLSSETIDLGKIKVGNPQPAQFVVTNISKEPLIIETASPTCGCTISDYTKSPIDPGKTGFISATYNAANIGSFTKTLTVKFAGINETMPIVITGSVLSAEDFDKQATPSQAVKTDATKPAAVTPAVKTTTTTTTKLVKAPVSKTTKTKKTTTTAPATK